MNKISTNNPTIATVQLAPDLMARVKDTLANMARDNRLDYRFGLPIPHKRKGFTTSHVPAKDMDFDYRIAVSKMHIRHLRNARLDDLHTFHPSLMALAVLHSLDKDGTHRR